MSHHSTDGGSDIPPTPIHAMVLAAGASRRLQGHVKALSRSRESGRVLIDHCLDALSELDQLQSTTLVLGPPHGALIERHLQCNPALRVLQHPEAGRGLGDSIALAARNLPAWTPKNPPFAILLLLADQPELSAQALRRWADTHDFSQPTAITSAAYPDGQWGPPILLGCAHRDSLVRLTGKAGAKSMIRRHANQLQVVSLVGYTGADLDTLQDLAAQGWQPCPDPGLLH